MRKKAERKTKTTMKTSKKSENAKFKIHEKKREMIIRKLQEIVKSHSDTHNSSNFDYIPQTRSTYKKNVQASPRRNSTFVQSNINNPNKDIVYNNYKCYRCEHFLEIPQNLSRSFCQRVSTVIGQCEVDLSFIQAVIWLKSTIAYASQIPIDKLRQIFEKQWSDKCNYSEVRHTDNVYIEQLGPPITEDLPTEEEIAIRNISTLPNLLNLSDVSCNVSSQVTYRLHSESENLQDESLVLTENLNKSHLIQERYTDCKTENIRSKEFLSAFNIIPETDSEMESEIISETDSDKNKEVLPFNIIQETEDSEAENFESCDIFDDEPKHQNKYAENIFFSQERCAYDRNEYKSNINRSIESLTITPISNSDLIDIVCNDSIDQIVNQISQTNISQIDNATHWKQRSASNSQVDAACQMQLSLSDVCNDDNFKIDEFQIYDNYIDTRIENDTENVEHDSAYSTSHIHAFNYDSVLKYLDDELGDQLKSTSNHFNSTNQRTPDTNTEHYCKLRSRKKKHEKITSSPSIIESMKTGNIENKRSPSKKQSLSEKHKSKQATNLSKEKEGNNEKMISANWPNFILDSLNWEQVILESVKVVLSRLCDERTAEEYATRRCWKGTLEEEAVNAVLNVSDMFRMEKKWNIAKIGRKEIVTAINETLDEMMMCMQLNKSVWIYCAQIILELCNSLSICIEVIDHLTTKLKPLQSILIEVMSQSSNRQNFCIIMNQLHLIFHALNIAMRKYRTVIPSGRRVRSAEKVIPHITDLSRTRYVDEELEDAGLNANAAEKQWVNTLENFINFVPFSEKSISLLNILLL